MRQASPYNRTSPTGGAPLRWQRKGNPLRIMCRIKSKRLNLFGLMSLDNRLSVYHSEQSLTGAFIVDSISDFADKDYTKLVVIVLDNGPIHRCQAVYDQLDGWEQKEVYLHFLPTYSPHLNPIEILWRYIKYRWLHKVQYGSWGRLKKAVRSIVAGFGLKYRIDFNEKISKNKVQFNSA